MVDVYLQHAVVVFSNSLIIMALNVNSSSVGSVRNGNSSWVTPRCPKQNMCCGCISFWLCWGCCSVSSAVDHMENSWIAGGKVGGQHMIMCLGKKRECVEWVMLSSYCQGALKQGNQPPTASIEFGLWVSVRVELMWITRKTFVKIKNTLKPLLLSLLYLTGRNWSQPPCLLAVVSSIDNLNHFNRLEPQ